MVLLNIVTDNFYIVCDYIKCDPFLCNMNMTFELFLLFVQCMISIIHCLKITPTHITAIGRLEPQALNLPSATYPK